MEIYNLIRIDQAITNAHAIRLFIFNQRLPQLAKESLRKSKKQIFKSGCEIPAL
jgi:hypothetical protein